MGTSEKNLQKVSDRLQTMILCTSKVWSVVLIVRSEKIPVWYRLSLVSSLVHTVCRPKNLLP
jgi:hypothetical protein